MVLAHRPVSDHAPTPAPEPLSGTPEWMENFWTQLVQKRHEPSCSTSTSSSTTPRDTGTRPKTSRRNSTRVTPPSDPEEELWIRALYEQPAKPPKWIINRAKWDKDYQYSAETHFISYPVKGGYTYTTWGDTTPFLDLEFKIAPCGKPYLWWGPKEELWRSLKKLNLKDPVIIEKIRIACSSNPDGSKQKNDEPSKESN